MSHVAHQVSTNSFRKLDPPRCAPLAGQQVSLLAWMVSKPYTKAVTGGGKGLLVLPLEDAAGDTALLWCDASVPCYARCAQT